MPRRPSHTKAAAREADTGRARSAKFGLRSRRTRAGAAAPTAHGAASRERILEATIAVGNERGYAGLSISAICDRADIAPTSLYWHFGSKEGLVGAMAERLAQTHVEQIEELANEVGDPLERLDRMIAGMKDLVKRRPFGGPDLTVAMASEGTVNRELARAVLKHTEREQHLIEKNFEESLGGPLPDLDLVARMIGTYGDQAALMQRFDPDGASVDRIFEDLRRAIALIIGHRIQEKLASDSSAPQGETT